MHEGVTIALVSVGFVLVGYFLYQQEQTTQVLLAKAIAQSAPPQKSALGELGDILGLAAKIGVAFI